MCPDWNRISDAIQSEIDLNKGVFSLERASDIQHYLDHGEYEMAFEYLYLEKFENPDSRNFLKAAEAKEIGKKLKLDQEQVYDVEFWSKFTNWLNA